MRKRRIARRRPIRPADVSVCVDASLSLPALSPAMRLGASATKDSPRANPRRRAVVGGAQQR
jgi:hypothetical protein